MADQDDEPTRPETPDALRLRRRPSGTFEVPRDLLDQLVDAKIRVLQERMAVVEARLAVFEAGRVVEVNASRTRDPRAE
jgi:hypothetical protein